MARKATVMVKTAAISHIGCVRKNNEDNFFLDGDYMLADEVDHGALVDHTSEAGLQMFAVCDGMGGLNGGERASLIAIEAMPALKKKTERSSSVEAEIQSYAETVSDAVYADAQVSGSKKQGTTMCMLVIRDEIGYVANVGDSRVYLMRMGELNQVSRDHSAVYDMFLHGKLTREQARLHPQGNIISRYIGQSKEVRPQNYTYTRQMKLCNGDRFLLCSDGLSDLLTHEQIQHILSSNESPQKAAECLVRTVLELGGKDNVTCIVGDIVGQKLQAPTKADLAPLSNSVETTGETTGS